MQILIIDDDETFCRLLVEVLDGMGLQAAWTTDGFTAYEMLAREDYDLCIIDVRMPLVLGTELAEAIREDHPRVKIILASAFADEVLQDYAQRMGILLLSKPFSTHSLRSAVERALHESISRN